MTNLSPTQRKYWLSNGKLANSIKLEWVNRIDNLCALSGTAMSPDLRLWVESVFGLEMVRVIQDYSIYTAPKLSPDIRNVINSAIPNFYDGVDINIEFARLFDKNCCPAICDTVASADDLPDPPTGCEFILVYDDIDPRYAAALYEWHDGTGWHYHADFNVVQESNGTFIQFEYEGLDGWQVIVNGVSYMGGSTTITFDNPVYYIEVEFVSPDGCRYTVPPFGEVPCYWYWDDVAAFTSCTIYPEGGAGVPIVGYSDVLLLQQDYPYLSLNIYPTDIRTPLLIYAPASVLSGWEIDYGSGQVPMTWLPTSPACPVQENFCYTATLNIDLTTYPDAIIQDINGIAAGTAIQLSPNGLSNTAALEVSLGEYLSVLYGGVVTCTITYVGTTYTIVIQNIPYYDITNPIIFPLSSITVERDVMDYVDFTIIQNTCP